MNEPRLAWETRCNKGIELKFNVLIYSLVLLLSVVEGYSVRQKIELASVPAVSPDGTRMAFVWNRDLWIASTNGGVARQLTKHPADDHWPSWSPDGSEIAFSSKRNGYWNVYRIPVAGGKPIQVTDHSEGYMPLEWYPDGKNILTQAVRDHGGLDFDRLFCIDSEGRLPDRMLFDAYGYHGTISPDQNRVLFVREGKNMLYRKGYSGPKASQIWLYDKNSTKFTLILNNDTGCRSPLWKSQGTGFYYVTSESGSFNLWEYDFKTKNKKQLTKFQDDSVILPRISRDGQTIVFRHKFEFYKFTPKTQEPPEKIELWSENDAERKPGRRRWYDSTWNNEFPQGLSWSKDFLELAFTAGGDLWIMDTILREPQLVCGFTSSHETQVLFDSDNEKLFFLRDFGDRVELWTATRSDPTKFWFRNRDFVLKPFAVDSSNKRLLTISPDGTRLAYVRGRGELVVTGIEKNVPQTLFVSDVRPWYEWSPDGKWMVVQAKDSFDNWDIWIVSTDGKRKPYNLSKHPGWDGGPRWSPDGKVIAFVGRRGRDDEMDLFYVYLSSEYEERNQRVVKIEEAENKIRNIRKNSMVESKKPPLGKHIPLPVEPEEEKWIPPFFRIEFDDLSNRIKRISLPGSKETDPFWHSASRKLAFKSDLRNNRGTYYVVMPSDFQPRMITKHTGYFPIWKDNDLHWMVDNVPSKMTGSTLKKYTFKSYQDTDREAYLKLGFRLIWRNLRDYFYDKSLNDKDWPAILNKYESHIHANIDQAGFSRLILMMLGELNASHLFFDLHDKFWPNWSTDNGWVKETIHLGLRFEDKREGPGLKVRDVIPGGPCDHDSIGVEAGDLLLEINGVKIGPKDRLVDFLNGRLSELIELTFSKGSKKKKIVIEPINYLKARHLLELNWINGNKKKTKLLSDGKIGYLHVDRMRWDDLDKFEADIFAEGYGKKGLVIDVRNNTGGFTADRMLYALRRPRHSFTIPRGGKRSYPQGYLDHPFWDKPIVVLCNQNTASNGEIFCHAIKSLKRGKLVGTPTAGSVISIYSNEKIMDLGDMSVPFRGWYVLSTKENMEGNGAQPDLIVWPEPGDIPAGKDKQLQTAVELLLKEKK